ncbi:hypothetical protein V8E36_005420 [Tilletia maclaganii]
MRFLTALPFVLSAISCPVFALPKVTPTPITITEIVEPTPTYCIPGGGDPAYGVTAPSVAGRDVEPAPTDIGYPIVDPPLCDYLNGKRRAA